MTTKVLLPSCRRRRHPLHPSLLISPLSPSGKSLLSLLLREQQGLLCSGADCQQIHPEPMHLAGEASSEVIIMQLWSYTTLKGLMLLAGRVLTGCMLSDADFGCRRKNCQEWTRRWGRCRSKSSRSSVWHPSHLCSCALCKPSSRERGSPCSEGNLDMLLHVHYESSLLAVSVMRCGIAFASLSWLGPWICRHQQLPLQRQLRKPEWHRVRHRG